MRRRVTQTRTNTVATPAVDQCGHDGEPPVLLLYGKSDEEDAASDYAPWCQAYLAGVDAAETDWFEFLGDSADSDEDAMHHLVEIHRTQLGPHRTGCQA